MDDTLSEASSPALFQSERQGMIVDETLSRGRVEVSELADRFGVTTETIRRDLSELQQQKLVRRVHGGAVPWERSRFEPMVLVRSSNNDAEKRRLARAAIAELPIGGTVIIDSGSTLTRFAEAIPSNAELRVVTNSLLIAQTLAASERVDVIVVGGKVRKNTLAMVDAETAAAIEPLAVDTLFISSDAASSETGLTTPYREEAVVKRAMIRAARRVVALVDHTKFGSDQLVRFARWDDVDVLITNQELDLAVRSAIEASGTTVIAT